MIYIKSHTRLNVEEIHTETVKKGTEEIEKKKMMWNVYDNLALAIISLTISIFRGHLIYRRPFKLQCTCVS